MKVVIFGLSVSSSWGNGHAVLWRGLIKGLLHDRHRIVFFERDTPYYSEHRDLWRLPEGGDLILYRDWESVRQRAASELSDADAAIVTSYCPDAIDASTLMLDSFLGVRCFYDLDTPVTLGRIAAGQSVDYIGAEGLNPFDLVLSFTGGAALGMLRDRLGARHTIPIYGSVDPEIYRQIGASSPRAALSYLGTHAKDREIQLQTLFLEPASLRTDCRFVIGGALYPPDFPWMENIWFLGHVPPSKHPKFYADSRMTLNITRDSMAWMGWCPSGRLFEAAACGVPILSDWFDGLDDFFEPGEEILIARSTEEALNALDLSDAELSRVAAHAKDRTLTCYSAQQRAREIIAALDTAATRKRL